MTKIISNKDNLQVLFEDNHIIAINKRVGDIVQGDKTGDKPLSDVVKEYLKEKYNKPGAAFLGVVHRLDRPTTGRVRSSTALPLQAKGRMPHLRAHPYSSPTRHMSTSRSRVPARFP